MERSITFGEGPKVAPVVEAEVWRLTDDFEYKVDCCVYTVPQGFLTDGASIPRFLWRLCGHPMATRRFPVAVIHDYLYSEPGGRSRAEVDELYHDGLVALGFPKWKANIEYWAIRLFGGSHWGSCK